MKKFVNDKINKFAKIHLSYLIISMKKLEDKFYLKYF